MVETPYFGLSLCIAGHLDFHNPFVQLYVVELFLYVGLGSDRGIRNCRFVAIPKGNQALGLAYVRWDRRTCYRRNPDLQSRNDHESNTKCFGTLAALQGSRFRLDFATYQIVRYQRMGLDVGHGNRYVALRNFNFHISRIGWIKHCLYDCIGLFGLGDVQFLRGVPPWPIT